MILGAQTMVKQCTNRTHPGIGLQYIEYTSIPYYLIYVLRLILGVLGAPQIGLWMR